MCVATASRLKRTRKRRRAAGHDAGPRPRQPDRRAHRLQRQAVPAVRDRAGCERRRGACRARSRGGAGARPRRERPICPGCRQAGARLAGVRARDRRRACSCGGHGRWGRAGDHGRPAERRRAGLLQPPWESRSAVLSGLAGDLDPRRRELARLCSRVEHHWVGARTGPLDQLASLLGEEVAMRASRPAATCAPSRCRSRWANGASSSSTPASSRTRRFGLQQAAARVPGVRALEGGQPARRRRGPGSRAAGAAARRRALHVISENARAC